MNVDAVIVTPGEALVQIARYRQINRSAPIYVHDGQSNAALTTAIAPSVIGPDGYIRVISLFGANGPASIQIGSFNQIERGTILSSTVRGLFTDKSETEGGSTSQVADFNIAIESVGQTIVLRRDDGAYIYYVDALLSVSGDAAVQVARYKYANTQSPIHAHAGQTNQSSTISSTPSVVTTQKYTRLISLFGANVSSTLIPLSEQIERGSESSGNIQLLFTDESQMDVGETESNSAQLGNEDESIGQIIVLSVGSNILPTLIDHSVDASIIGEIIVNYNVDADIAFITKEITHTVNAALQKANLTQHNVDAVTTSYPQGSYGVDALLIYKSNYTGEGLGSVGYGGGAQTSQLMTARLSKPAFAVGHISSSAFRSAYVRGHQNIINPQPAYIRSVGQFLISKPAFIHGDRYTIDITKGAYIYGKALAIFYADEQWLYINGGAAPTITSVKSIFIVSYGMIGDWNLDDGISEPFKNTASDAALGNTMLFDRNPTWVPGPHCGGEP